MKLLVGIVSLLIAIVSVQALGGNLICYYDALGSERQGLAQFYLSDLEISLQFCSHLVYGYVGLDDETFALKSNNDKLDLQKRHFATVTALKEKYPHIKFLLSVGGLSPNIQTETYIKLLESGRAKQSLFIDSARDLLRRYNFDGLDLAFQLPTNKPRKVHSDVGKVWKGFKKFFTGDFIVDEKSEEHKQQFTDLVYDLRNAFRPNDLMLSLTVLPNVNSSWYYDGPALINNLDYVNLAAFDWLTPQRNPQEADYTAPLYELYEQDRLGHYNLNYQVEYWILQRIPANKIVIGVASYGQAWKLSKDSGLEGKPVVHDTLGPAPPGPQLKMEGKLDWPEICFLLPNAANSLNRGPLAPLRRATDPSKRYGTYAYRPADDNDENGIWVSYDDPDAAANKAGYAKAKSLGGVALFDLTLDDFRGQCTGDKFPILRAIKYRLL